jgi:hypothetical protein
MKKVRRLGLLTFIIIALAVGGYEIALQRAYMDVESLTQEYSAEIQPILIKSIEKEGKLGDHLITDTVEYFKVFNVTLDTAKVFVVSDVSVNNGANQELVDREGEFKYLKKVDGSWQVDTAKPIEVIWSWYSSELIVKRTWPPYY